jgi:hypothetical protein
MLGADEGSFEIGRYLMMDAIRKTLREAIRGTPRPSAAYTLAEDESSSR